MLIGECEYYLSPLCTEGRFVSVMVTQPHLEPELTDMLLLDSDSQISKKERKKKAWGFDCTSYISITKLILQIYYFGPTCSVQPSVKLLTCLSDVKRQIFSLSNIKISPHVAY